MPSSVTAPVRAKALPTRFAPVFRVMLSCARMFPWKAVVVPRVAELPTRHCAAQGLPPMNTTDEPLAVVSVLPIRKTHTAFGLPRELSVSTPVNCADVEKQ